MAPEGENFRSLHAVQLLSQHKGVTLDELIRIGYSPSLSAFDTLLPPLISAYAAQGPAAPADPVLKEAIDSLKLWDKNAAVSSVATTIGVLWAGTVLSQSATVPDSITNDHVKFISWAIRHTSDKDKITALTNLLTALKNAFGTWKVPWGQINRFQRLDGSEALQFDHNKESVPVGLGPAYLGSLPSYETVWQGNQQFGVAGNSFVAAVSFGQRLKAKSISTGGQSFASNSKHFSDQAERFLNGVLKDVYFYREDVLRHAEKSYHPGEK
jgi:acyl-homoserine lactone acylase PvdQ